MSKNERLTEVAEETGKNDGYWLVVSVNLLRLDKNKFY